EQEKYEQVFQEYDGKKRLQGLEWRQAAEEAKEQLMRDPGAGGEAYRQALEKSNEELRASLRLLKEEVAESANERDRVRQAFQDDFQSQVQARLEAIRGRRQYKTLLRLFKAFPEIEPVRMAMPGPWEDSVEKAMLTKDLSVASYVWQAVREMVSVRYTGKHI
ncbi:MAG: hypothetical protein FWF83_08425, partial [Clostridiales bacterium]|nr:hypothetical protein [Clostridiales bacterium]